MVVLGASFSFKRISSIIGNKQDLKILVLTMGPSGDKLQCCVMLIVLTCKELLGFQTCFKSSGV